MFQREVAARIRATPGDDAYGALSVFTALYWKIDLHFTVAAGSFHPRPKVDAEVLAFTPLAKPSFADVDERDVLETVRASFSAPRKTIRNALSHALGIDSAQTVQALEARCDRSGHSRGNARRARFSETRALAAHRTGGRVVARDA